jgi:hypothetical protein
MALPAGVVELDIEIEKVIDALTESSVARPRTGNTKSKPVRRVADTSREGGQSILILQG